MTVQIENRDVLDFVEYVYTFYNPVNGVYPIKGATIRVVTRAIETYINKTKAEDFVGDSVDREFVRDIILAQNPECEVIA